MQLLNKQKSCQNSYVAKQIGDCDNGLQLASYRKQWHHVYFEKSPALGVHIRLNIFLKIYSIVQAPKVKKKLPLPLMQGIQRVLKTEIHAPLL